MKFVLKSSRFGAPVQVRAYRRTDLDILHAIDAACFPPDISYSLEELRSFIHHRGARTWVAEVEGEIVGFLVGQHFPRNLSAHIVTLDVKQASRRQGIGKTLMGAAEVWARDLDCQRLSLETAEDNLEAQAFYVHLGYARMGTIENYYGNGATAWVMVKPIG